MKSLDDGALRSLRRMVGDVVFIEVIEEYLVESAELASQIEHAGDAQDFPKICSAAHKLKSTANLVGATGLADVCALLERVEGPGRGGARDIDAKIALVSSHTAASQQQLRRVASNVERDIKRASLAPSGEA